MAIYRLARNLLAPCQRGGCEEPCNPSLHYNPLADDTRGTCTAAHHTCVGAPLNWHRAYRRHHCRPCTGFGQNLIATIYNISARPSRKEQPRNIFMVAKKASPRWRRPRVMLLARFILREPWLQRRRQQRYKRPKQLELLSECLQARHRECR